MQYIVEKNGKLELVATTIIYEETFNNYVAGYELVNNKFVKVWEYDWRNYMDIVPTEQVIITKVVDGEIKYYLLKAVKGYDHKNGRKNYWILDKEYDIQKEITS